MGKPRSERPAARSPRPAEGLSPRARDGDLLAIRRYERDVPSAGQGHRLGQWVLGVALAAIVLAPATYAISFLASPAALALSQLERHRARTDGREPSELAEIGRKMCWAVFLLVYLPVAIAALFAYLDYMRRLKT